MMDCKKALVETNGDKEAAKELLRKAGVVLANKRADRETAFGRFGIYAGVDKKAGAVVELKCESAPVAGSEEFINLANGLAEALALGGDAASAEELLDRKYPGKSETLRAVKDEMFNRIREVFNVGRFKRFEGGCGGYSHNSGTVSGCLVQVVGGTDEAAKNVAMHAAAMRPVACSRAEVAADLVEKERTFLREAAIKEGKPENIVDKMVEGRLKNFFAEKVLLEQPYVKENSMTVGKFAEESKMQVKQFVLWELGRE
jgi:elongation factor Ts